MLQCCGDRVVGGMDGSVVDMVERIVRGGRVWRTNGKRELCLVESEIKTDEH